MNYIKEKRVLWIIVLIYIVFFSAFTAFRHYNFHTQTWDMGIFAQTMWNTTHGNFMQNSIEEVSNHLGVHMSPFLILLVPDYFLFPSPYTLLITQTILIALGAIPLYFLAKRLLGDAKIWPLLIAGGYLLYPSLHWINTFDFHVISFLVPLLITAFYFIESKNWTWAAIFLMLSASTKEDAILVVLFVGLYLLLKPKEGFWWNNERKLGLATVILSILYFIIAVQFIMPALGGGLVRLDRYEQLGSTPAEMITNTIQNPQILISTIFTSAKLRYVFWLLLPVAFLPLFSGRAIILLIPGLLENLLTNFSSQFSNLYQYDSVLVAGIFIASIYGLKNILNKYPQKSNILKWLLVFTMVVAYIMRSPVNPLYFPTNIFTSTPKQDAYRAMVNLVPPEIVVSAHTNILPHLTNRKNIYMLGTEQIAADVVLVDATDIFGFASQDQFEAYINSYFNTGQYRYTTIENKYLVIFHERLNLHIP